MKLFLSHISEEAPLAATVKQWIETTFLGNVKVFLSTDSRDLPPGAKWLAKIEEAMSEADALLVLASPDSLKRPWVNFEAGFGWARSIEIIPLCHSGQRRSGLPRPLSDFQAVDLLNRTSLEAFFKLLAEKVGVARLPKIHYETVVAECERAIESGLREQRETYDEANVDFIERYAKLFQAEEMKTKVGEVKDDDGAINGKARFVNLRGFRDHLVYGPYEELAEPGDYVAFFRIKIGEEYPAGPVLLVEYYSPGEYSSRVVVSGEFLRRLRYQVFGLRFNTKGGGRKEYRVLPLLPFGKIWVDFVARARLEELPVKI